MIKNSLGEHYSLHDMEKMYVETRAKLADAIYEKEMYSKDSREIRGENASLKQYQEFNKKNNEEAFRKLLSKLFPNFWRTSCLGKGFFPHVIEDYEDGMLGLVMSGLGSSPMKCYMQDETIRNIDINKKNWVQIY